MDVLSTPRRPHKSPAHTVKDRIFAQRFRFRVPNISSERAAYYTTIFVSVNTFLKTFSKKFCRYFALRSRQRRHQSKGGESYIRFPIRQHPRNDFFASPCQRPGRSPFAAPQRFRPHDEGPRILQPIPDSSSPRTQLSCRRRAARYGAMRQPNEPARTNACRSAADARRPRRACVRDPRPQRRLYAPPSR